MPLELWNDAMLSPPPVNTFLCRDKLDLQRLTKTLKDLLNTLSVQDPLHKEAALLSRMIYKFDRKFRHDIGYSYVRRTNVALRRYLTVNLQGDVKNFLMVVPERCSNENYLPTRQMLEYILVRLQSFTKIIVRIIFCSKKAAIFYFDRMKRGDSNWMALMPYAVLSRIWSLCNVLLKDACEYYLELFPYIDQLKCVGVAFLPESYALPICLKTWLEVDKIDDIGRVEWRKCDSVEVSSVLADIGDENDIFTIMNYVTDVRQEIENLHGVIPSTKDLQKSKLKEDRKGKTFESNSTSAEITKLDIGESISRKELKRALNLEQTIVKPEKIVRGNNVNISETDIGESIPRKKVSVALKKNPTKEKIHQENNNFDILATRLSDDTDAECNETNINSTIEDEIKKKGMQKTKSKNSIETVIDIETLNTFITNEERLRNNKSKSSATKHLSLMQWIALKTMIQNLIDADKSPGKTLKRFRKTWKERCLDYL